MPTGPSEIVLRLPRTAYLIVLFVVLGVIPLALAETESSSLQDSTSGAASAGVAVGPRLLLFLVPIAVAFYIARTATFVGPDGIRIRALLGARRFSWDEIRGITVVDRSVYVAVAGGSVRLPCARIAHLRDITTASAGRLPEVERHVAKPAPSRRRRR